MIINKIINSFNLQKKIVKPIIFDHLPKCGGSTINEFLMSNYPKKFVFGISGTNPFKSISIFKSMSSEQRNRFKFIYGHGANQLFDYISDKMIKTTVIREPVDRIVSHYYFVKSNKKHYLHDVVVNNNIQIQDYCHLELTSELENWYVSHFSGFSKDEMNSEPQKALNIAYSNLINKYDVIGFQNDISSYLEELSIYANIGKKYNGKKINVTVQRKKVSQLENEQIEKIKEKNQLDIYFYELIQESIQSKKIKPS